MTEATVMKGAGALLIVLGSLASPTQSRIRLDVLVSVSEVADSQAYFVYSYELLNRPASEWGLSAFDLDIGADEGTPPNLPTTGELYDFMTGRGPTRAHAQVGPIAPPGWSSILGVPANLTWALPAGALVSEDSVAPGERVDGFGIRSTYLPGIARVVAIPTPESCCQEPFPGSPADEPQYPLPDDMGVAGTGIAPRYRPAQVDPLLLLTQLEAACFEHGWINDAQLCDQLRTHFQAASDGARDATERLTVAVTILERNRAPNGPVEDNAYWLLTTNARQAITNANVRE